MDDAVWLREIGRWGWVLLTADHRVRGGAELIALREANIISFFFYKGFTNKHRETQTKWFLARRKAIEEQAAVAQRGDCYEVPEKGKIKKVEVFRDDT